MSPAPPAGRVAVVTGGGGGIGRAVVKVLASAGSAVAVLDRDEGAARSAAERAGPPARSYRVDVRDAASVEAAVATVRQDLGRPSFWCRRPVSAVPSSSCTR